MTTIITPPWELTNERTESRYGFPVLVNRHDNEQAYGPADIIIAYRQAQPAAHFVHRYASMSGNSSDKEFARQFLSQWPEGPQLL